MQTMIGQYLITMTILSVFVLSDSPDTVLYSQHVHP